MKPLLAALLCGPFAFVVASATAATPAAAATGSPQSTDKRFEAIYQKEWKWRQAEFGMADEDNDNSGSRHDLPSVDAASQAARLRVWDGVLRELSAIDPAQLSAENRINLAIYHDQIDNLAAGIRLRDYEMPLNSDSSFWSNLGFMTRRPLHSVEDYQAYIDRLSDVPRYFDQNIANMRAGLARGFSVPRAVLDGRDASIAMVAQVADPEQSGFYEPFKKMPATISATEQSRLRAAGAKAIRERLIPAYARLLVFFREEYVPKARATLGAEQLPDGVAYYRQQIREYTTLDLDPEQIHKIGLQEVARIQGEMDAIIDKVGFTAPAGENRFAAFLKFLRTDKQFYATSSQDLLARAAWISKRVDGEIGKFIGTLPRERFTIVPVPADIAPFWTSGRGGAGTYWVNTYDLPSRPLYNLPALTLHESAPGHALQGSLAKEQGQLPEFRRNSYISAYGEGWGLYSEKLGKEMGIYETPYEDFGRLSYEMWRACRLVIDTGVHHKGWTRDQALAYLRDHTALSEHEVTTEVDRYISWPGQALSYKLGEITIVRLRAEAEKALGPKFDIKAFHDTLLSQGSVPLPVLEQQVRAYIAKTAATKAASGAATAP